MKRTVVAAGAALVLALVAGCSDSETSTGGQAANSSTGSVSASSPVEPTSAAASTEAEASTQVLYEVTDAGLTVAVNVPVNASAAEMAEGCAEAKAMFAMLGTNDIETALALMQATAEDSTESFTVETDGTPWADATPQEQAQVIAAVNAAARGEC